ncbi:MAG: aldehyde dehydrogenase (NADP(+)) [Acidobacteriia bacterium]|nr:aldehyde dehydrogenase (NADP(+)) [Terriglobia bacterium]
MRISGRSIIGFQEGGTTGEVFRATRPWDGTQLLPDFVSATFEEVTLAARLAHEAFATYGRCSGHDKGALLRKIAAKIESMADQVIERAEQETALPKVRLQGETARTCAQLRLFAQVVEEGSWTAARIDTADPERKPIPKPDIRSMLRPIGPVVVFGASNFPLAFSVAGGDTASALAAGNPVIVKAHHSHPGTSEIVGRAVQESVRECGLPEGVFSLLFGSGTQVGTALAQNPLVKAVGFTGSRRGGRALMYLAAARPEPIQVFAEMSSTNPVFILPGAMRERGEQIAAGLHGSFTLGAGQFCTKPGMVFFGDNADAVAFTEKLRQALPSVPQFTMLNAGITSSYRSVLASRKKDPAVRLLAETQPSAEFSVGAALFETDATSFLANPVLADEMFGPATQLVRYSNCAELMEIARSLEGHLTATIHGTEQDLREFPDLIAVLENKVGRVVFNGFPTGVEVCHAMVHGGPVPSTSDGRSTSVGSQAIFRWVRPVCYQGFPDAVLSEELRDTNPLAIWRMVDGELTRQPIGVPSGG